MNEKKNFSRRSFIERTLIGAAGTGLAFSNPLMAKSSDMISRKTIAAGQFKIGILGCGNRSKTIISALNEVPEIAIGALCDLVPHKMTRRSELIKKGPKPVFFTDMREMLNQDDLDAVAVLTPNYMHKDHTVAALESGKDVFCEKPMALTVADCNEMIATVQRTRKALQIGTQRRHSSAFKMLVETIRNSSVGKILQSDLNDYRGDWRVPGDDEYSPGVEYWRLDQSKCGGVIYEMGAHIIDANNWIFDSEPLSVSSIQGVNNLSLRRRDSMDHAGVLVRYANNALMNYGGNLYNYGQSAANTFYGVNGSVMFDGKEISIRYGHPRGFPIQEELPKPVKKEVPKEDGVVMEMKYFARVLAGEKKPYPDGYIGRQTVQICEAAMRSAKERREIDIRELG
jgi:predicted dehydrogenase